MLELILDRGLVIDAFVRVALVGIEVLTIDARVVVASVDTYLRFAEACNRLDLGAAQPDGLPGLVGEVTRRGFRRAGSSRGGSGRGRHRALGAVLVHGRGAGVTTALAQREVALVDLLAGPHGPPP